MAEKKDTKLYIGGLYVNTVKGTGKTFLSGRFTFGSKILIFQNDRKQKNSDPDWQMYLVPAVPKDQRKPTEEAAPRTEQEDDNVPF